MCFLGLFCDDSTNADSTAAGNVQTPVDHNVNSTILLQTIFDLRDGHATHFSDVKMLLYALILLVLLVAVGLLTFCYCRRTKPAPRRQASTVDEIKSLYVYP